MDPWAAIFPAVGFAKKEEGPLVPNEPTNQCCFHPVFQKGNINESDNNILEMAQNISGGHGVFDFPGEHRSRMPAGYAYAGSGCGRSWPGQGPGLGSAP